MINVNKRKFINRIKKLRKQKKKNDKIIKSLSPNNPFIEDTITGLNYENHKIDMELMFLETQLKARKAMDNWN